MKNSILITITLFLAITLLLPLTVIGQEDSTGLPGDHFSLMGALELFKQSKSLEAFEKSINQENSYINNLDLNQDGDIDYIRVEDHVDQDVHAIVLQAVVSKKESQDIAVIEIEKNGEKSALLQIIGDEDIYGENVIVEPFEEEGIKDGRKGPSSEMETVRIVVNVWLWPSVRFIYAPVYRPWISPWRWTYYPTWWSPWRPRPYRWHYSRRAHYHAGFHVVHTHRVVRAHRVYTPQRRASVAVRTTHKAQINHYRTNTGVKKTGTITQSTKRKVVTGPNGGKAVVSKKTTKGAVSTSRDKKAVGTKSTTTIAAKKGDKKMVAQKKESKGAIKSQGKTVAGKSRTKTVAASGPKKSAAAQKKTSARVKNNKNRKTAKKTTTKRAVKKRKN